MTKNTFANVLSVEKVLNKKLHIPNYQRPYRWDDKHVSQLINDVIHHQDKSEYRLGTLVVHDNAGAEREAPSIDVVDGQQRLLTIALIITAIKTIFEERTYQSELFDSGLPTFIAQLNIENDQTIAQLKRNSVLVRQLLTHRDESALEKLGYYLLKQCSVVFIQLNDISEAFQFFDSQNARGKALEPYDLLKAYHLREMMSEPKKQRSEIIAKWEEQAGSHGKLKGTFDNFLFRIRSWINNEQGRYFSKDEISIFKGLNPDSESLPPYFTLYRYSHHLADNYNQDNMRNIDKQKMIYPFGLGQVMLNGRRFFEFVDHYIVLLDKLKTHPELVEFIEIKNYAGNKRKGDQYTKNLFVASLLLYFDKFGDKSLKQAGKLCFLWAYKMRLSHQAVQLATMDNWALHSDSLIYVINKAVHAKDVLNYLIPPLERNVATKVEGIVEIFKNSGMLPK